MMQGKYTWTSFYDSIWLINLPHRGDRYTQAKEELQKHDIPFRLWSAQKDDNGRRGLQYTLRGLLLYCVKNHHQRILVFEDDVQFVKSPQFDMLNAQVQLLAHDKAWELLYMGLNTHQPLDRVSENLLKVKNAYALHAVSYSMAGMLGAMEAFSEHPDEAVDVAISKYVQENGHSYCTFPLLATQRPSYSDIEKKDVHYDFIEKRYIENTKHLL